MLVNINVGNCPRTSVTVLRLRGQQQTVFSCARLCPSRHFCTVALLRNGSRLLRCGWTVPQNSAVRRYSLPWQGRPDQIGPGYYAGGERRMASAVTDVP